MQSSQDGNGGNGALLPSLMRLRLLGRPGSLLFLGDHLLGFLLPFQLLLDEVELLMPLLPELLSRCLASNSLPMTKALFSLRRSRSKSLCSRCRAFQISLYWSSSLFFSYRYSIDI